MANEIRRGWLTEGQILRFLEHEPRADYRALWLIMADCGLRISEALRLQRADIVEAIGDSPLQIKGKRNRIRYVGLTRRAAAAVHRNTLRRLAASTESHSASLISSTPLSG